MIPPRSRVERRPDTAGYASPVEGGSLWLAMHTRPRQYGGQLQKADIPPDPGVYAWYRDDAAVYVGKADRLKDRL
jgi:hypothetical protein